MFSVAGTRFEFTSLLKPSMQALRAVNPFNEPLAPVHVSFSPHCVFLFSLSFTLSLFHFFPLSELSLSLLLRAQGAAVLVQKKEIEEQLVAERLHVQALKAEAEALKTQAASRLPPEEAERGWTRNEFSWCYVLCCYIYYYYVFLEI